MRMKCGLPPVEYHSRYCEPRGLPAPCRHHSVSRAGGRDGGEGRTELLPRQTSPEELIGSNSDSLWMWAPGGLQGWQCSWFLIWVLVTRQVQSRMLTEHVPNGCALFRMYVVFNPVTQNPPLTLLEGGECPGVLCFPPASPGPSCREQADGVSRGRGGQQTAAPGEALGPFLPVGTEAGAGAGQADCPGLPQPLSKAGQRSHRVGSAAKQMRPGGCAHPAGAWPASLGASRQDCPPPTGPGGPPAPSLRPLPLPLPLPLPEALGLFLTQLSCLRRRWTKGGQQLPSCPPLLGSRLSGGTGHS